MAKKPQSAVQLAKARAAAKGGKGEPPGVNKVVVMMILAALVPFSLPTVTLVFVTMLPTAVAWLTEKGANKYAWLCVGGLNFAGLVPYLFSLWFGVHTLDEALRMLGDPSMLLVSYGCAGFGWVMYVGMPPLVHSYLSFSSERRVSNLRAAQKKLVEEWGEDVARKQPN